MPIKKFIETSTTGRTFSPPPLALSDEGVTIDLLNATTLVNLTDPDPVTGDPLKARRRELHLHGRTFAHTAENGAGQWMYRHD